MVTINGEITANHKAVETVDADTGEVRALLMPIWKLERLGYNVEPGVQVRVVVSVRVVR